MKNSSADWVATPEVVMLWRDRAMLPTAENRKPAKTAATPAGKATAGLVTKERATGAATRAADDSSASRRRIISSR
jgi:hypothetical protein